MGLKAGYKQTEVGVIPTDWEVWPVKRMGQVITGKALAARAPGKQRPYLRTKNVFDGYIDTEDVLTMPMSDAQFAQFMVHKGDSLLNEGQSLELVGRCAMYRGEYPEPCAIQNQLLRFRTKPGTDRSFACQLFRRCQHTGMFAKVALQTTSIAHLGGKRFENLRLAWPSTEEEQKAIGDTLEDGDRLIEGLERLIVKKRHLKLAVMHQLLTDSPRPPWYSGPLRDTSLSELVTAMSGGTPSLRVGAFWDGDIPWVSAKDMKVSVLTDAPMRVTSIALKHGAKIAPAGSVLLVVRGMILAHSFPVAIAARPIAFNQDIRALVPKEGVDAPYIAWWLRANARRMLSATTEATHGTKRLASAELLGTRLAIPPIREQLRIARVLSDMDAELGALEARLNKTKDIKQGMMQELLIGRIRLSHARTSANSTRVERPAQTGAAR